MKKRFLSGVKPTGRPHIGNYFGAMKQFVDLTASGEYESFVFVADYHGLNFIQNGPEMRQLIIDLVKDYIAIGLDPSRVLLYKQSDVPEHAELTWIFDTITTMPYLMRAHAYKDAEAKGKEVTVGTFNYPMLMAADILLYDPDYVPVGQDQKQHVEFARDTAEKFNRIFGETFKLPEHMILPDVAIVPGTDGRKMSKSYGNGISLFGTREEIAQAVMSIVTDSGIDDETRIIQSEGRETEIFVRPMNLFRIHRLYRQDYNELKNLYLQNQSKYAHIKEVLIDDIDAVARPMREKRESITDDEVRKVLKEGGEKARQLASEKMSLVRKNIGVAL
jgi:tryptophanyl-tRNA synthetase